MPTRAIIFDLDDTLVATSALWKQAETVLLEAIGQAWRPEVAATHKGMNALDVAAVIHRHYQPSIPLAEAQRIMRDALLHQFETTLLQPMPGAKACVLRVAKKWPIAVASGSPPAAIERALTRLDMFSAFAVVVSSESVKRGKPSPDVYLRTAEVLAVTPQDCEAVEDSAIGAQAAHAAGMTCHLVPSTPEARRVMCPGVHVVNSLGSLFLT